MNLSDIIRLQKQAEAVHVHDEIINAVAHILRDTRHHPDISLGGSTRSGIAFLKCLRAYAMIKGRSFVIEDDVNDIAFSVLDHRLLYRNKDGREKALHQIISKEVERLAKLKLF